MTEEFVLLGSAPTDAIARSELPERFARAAPNPLPLFPRAAGAARGRVGVGVSIVVVLATVVPPAVAAFASWLAGESPPRGWPGSPERDVRDVRSLFDDAPPPIDTPAPDESDAPLLADGVYPDLGGPGAWSCRIAAAGGETLIVSARSQGGDDPDLELFDASGRACGHYERVDGGRRVTWRVEREQVLRLVVHAQGGFPFDLTIERQTRGLGPGLARGLAASRAGTSHRFEPIGAEQVLMVTVRFQHAAGDVDARIVDEHGVTCAVATGTADVERLLVRDARRCRELILFGADSVADVEVQLVDWLDAATGWALEAPCARRVFVRAGQALRARARFAHAEGDVDLQLIHFSGAVLVESTTSTDQEEVRWVAPADGEVVLRLFHAGAPLAARSRVDLDIELGP